MQCGEMNAERNPDGQRKADEDWCVCLPLCHTPSPTHPLALSSAVALPPRPLSSLLGLCLSPLQAVVDLEQQQSEKQSEVAAAERAEQEAHEAWQAKK